MAPEPRPGVLQIHTYKPGDSSIEGKARVFKLASNESPFGPSPAALKAMRGACTNPEHYPDGGSLELRAAIAEAYGVKREHIVAGTGSEQLLGLIAQCFAGPGDEIIQSEFGFLVYRIVTLAAGADLVTAPEQNYTTDVDAILACATERTKIVFLANPNNPTGTTLSASEVRRLREGLPRKALLVIDAAYAEYVIDPDYTDGHELVREAMEAGTNNVITTHTFSKIYGLAALRLGWCYGPPHVVDALNRVRPVFNVSTIAQAAGIAAVGDREHLVMSREHNARWLPRLTAALEDMGLRVPPSAGNFVLAEFPGGTDQAARADRYMRNDGIIVRPVGGYGLGQCLRITIGTDEQNAALLDSLGRFMAG